MNVPLCVRVSWRELTGKTCQKFLFDRQGFLIKMIGQILVPFLSRIADRTGEALRQAQGDREIDSI